MSSLQELAVQLKSQRMQCCLGPEMPYYLNTCIVSQHSLSWKMLFVLKNVYLVFWEWKTLYYELYLVILIPHSGILFLYWFWIWFSWPLIRGECQKSCTTIVLILIYHLNSVSSCSENFITTSFGTYILVRIGPLGLLILNVTSIHISYYLI